MGGVRAGRAMRSSGADRVAQVAERPPQSVPRKAFSTGTVRYCSPNCASSTVASNSCQSERKIEPVSPWSSIPPLLREVRDVEVRGEAHDSPALELDDGDAEIGRLRGERLARQRRAVGIDDRPEGSDTPGGPEHGREDRERIDAHVCERADAVEGLRARVPALDPVPVDLRVRDAHPADRARVDEPPHRLLRLSEERDGRAGEPEPAVRRQVDERPRGSVVPGERLLAVHVLARLQGRARHFGVDGRKREIDDRVDVRIAEDVVEGRVVDASEALDEGRAQRTVHVGRAGDPDRRVRAHRLAVRARDVPAADDGDAEGVLRHRGRPARCESCSRVRTSMRAHSSVGSRSNAWCSMLTGPV